MIERLSAEQKTAQSHLEQVADLQKKLAHKEQTLERKLARKDQIIAQLQRMLFGQKRERFAGDPAQGSLPFEQEPLSEQEHEQHHQKTITYVRKKQSRPNHKGRLPLPDHLPVEEIEIYPQGDLSQMVCIGKEVTEELEMTPARFYIKRYIRYKYAAKDFRSDGVHIGELPERVIDKGIPGAGLLAGILVDKYVDHLPLYRQRQRFLRENIPIAQTTLDGWAAQAMDRLEILYNHLLDQTKARGYLQVDESRIKVLESPKKGACHQGWYWVYHSPIEKTVLFDYHPTRGAPAPKRILDEFTGYLQSDGYSVYEEIGRRKDVVHLGCWAHARREFERALENDRERAEKAMNWIQDLYAVERQARDKGLCPQGRKELRLARSLPIINELGGWIKSQIAQVLPKSQIGKAMAYSAKRWDALSGYLYDGVLEIDNNLVENTIRPLALGRKNYLFTGSHKGAQRAAMVYSLLGTCKLHGVNPTQWLTHVLANILQTKYNDVPSLYPQNFTDKQSVG
ncbi:MAG: IS66 family transposase [Balneolaceae bacterium]|nr:IS66 family transposase [Balneolaceae bacterium]